MKSHFVLPTCLLLVWTLTVFVICQEKKEESKEITVKEVADGIELSCADEKKNVTSTTRDGIKSKNLHLTYSDNNTGEYMCEEEHKIFVKFRTCDNCVELDTGSIVTMIIGDVVATIVIGVGVYLIASQARTGPVVSNKKSKSSDRQHLVSESRGPTNDHYQPLRPRGGQKDTYDELVHRR